MGLREAGKQATRGRVLNAARDLFDEVGYEPAAIRDIASRAGVSVGSVFTTFGGKAELLCAVMNDRLENLYADLDRVVPHLRGDSIDRLRSIMALHYGFEVRRLRLFVSYIGVAYACAAQSGVALFDPDLKLRRHLEHVLRQGVERGEVRADADVEGCADAILAAYCWNYFKACQPQADPDILIALMDRQIGVLFQGVAA